MLEFVKNNCFTCYVIVDDNKRKVNCCEWINDEAMLRWFNMIECCVDGYSTCEYMMWSASMIMWIVVNTYWWLLNDNLSTYIWLFIWCRNCMECMSCCFMMLYEVNMIGIIVICMIIWWLIMFNVMMNSL